MTDDQLMELLCSAVPPRLDEGPRRDLWPEMAARFDQRHGWSYTDISLAAATAIALAVFPEWLWLIAYHL